MKNDQSLHPEKERVLVTESRAVDESIVSLPNSEKREVRCKATSNQRSFIACPKCGVVYSKDRGYKGYCSYKCEQESELEKIQRRRPSFFGIHIPTKKREKRRGRDERGELGIYNYICSRDRARVLSPTSGVKKE